MDYRALNQLTIKDQYPILMNEELLEKLVGATIFSNIDLKSGYHQILMTTGEKFKTAFRTYNGNNEFLLTNAPATFQSLMNEVLRKHLRKFILVYNHTLIDHYKHFKMDMKLLRAH